MGETKCCFCVPFICGLVMIFFFHCIEALIYMSNFSLTWPIFILKVLVIIFFLPNAIARESQNVRSALFTVYLAVTIIETVGSVIIIFGMSQSYKYYRKSGCTALWDDRDELSRVK